MVATVDTLPPVALREAVEVLWRLWPAGPRNLFALPEFVRLGQTCETLYSNARHGFKDSRGNTVLAFALANALDALGCPAALPSARRHLALPADVAAARLHAGFERREMRRTYLCPLDSAANLPDLTFGPNRIARLSAAELEGLFDFPRLKRSNAEWRFDAKLFSECTWLVVEETLPLRAPPGQRAIPELFEPGGRDWGAIEPHRGRFAPAVVDALFAMLLAPWEDWVNAPSGWWRAFEVPWEYRIDNDIFVRPEPLPLADTLSGFFTLEDHGEEVFVDPNRIPLKDSAAGVSDWLTDRRWADLMAACRSELFQTPVKHFFVKAFLEELADEFLAHITTIEAALLLESERSGLTRRVARRVSALLEVEQRGKVYEDLYNVRCAVVHGRKMDAIPGSTRFLARQLARQVVVALVQAALDPSCPQSREVYLRELAS